MLSNRPGGQWVRKRREGSWKRGGQLSSPGPWVLPNSRVLRTDIKDHAGSVRGFKGKSSLRRVGNGGGGEDAPRAPRPSPRRWLWSCFLVSSQAGPRAERASPLPVDIGPCTGFLGLLEASPTSWVTQTWIVSPFQSLEVQDQGHPAVSSHHLPGQDVPGLDPSAVLLLGWP